MGQKVIVKLCGESDPQGPVGWPKGVTQYDDAGPKPEMLEGDKDMTLDEYQAYCNFLRPIYQKWEHDKTHGIIDVKATEVKHEPDTHESYEQEVLKPKRAKKAKKE